MRSENSAGSSLLRRVHIRAGRDLRLGALVVAWLPGGDGLALGLAGWATAGSALLFITKATRSPRRAFVVTGQKTTSRRPASRSSRGMRLQSPDREPPCIIVAAEGSGIRALQRCLARMPEGSAGFRVARLRDQRRVPRQRRRGGLRGPGRGTTRKRKAPRADSDDLRQRPSRADRRRAALSGIRASVPSGRFSARPAPEPTGWSSLSPRCGRTAAPPSCPHFS